MDDRRFDRLTRALATGSSRRGLIARGLAAGIGAGTLQLSRASPARAWTCDSNADCGAASSCCGGSCTPTSFDSQNCGSCGRRCSMARGEVCSGGACVARGGGSGGQSGGQPGPGMYTSAVHGFSLSWDATWSFRLASVSPGSAGYDDLFHLDLSATYGEAIFGALFTASDPGVLINADADLFSGYPAVRDHLLAVDESGQPMTGSDENWVWGYYTFVLDQSPVFEPYTGVYFRGAGWIVPGQSVIKTYFMTRMVAWDLAWSQFQYLLQSLDLGRTR